MNLELAAIRALDRSDILAPLRDRFDLPPGVIYLDGNSLGALPRQTAARVADVVKSEWGSGLIRSWNTADWIGAPARVGAKIARIVGAMPHEVIVADSTSVNLFKLLMAGLADRPGRHVILSETGNFPTDLYVAQGVGQLMPGVEIRIVSRDTIEDAIDETVAVLMLTHVHYKSGARFDMPALTRAAHAKGALVLWDLSHSVGAVPLDLNGAKADLAIGCGYKYLNGGPGAPSFLFVAEPHQARLQSPLSGWMGHAKPFAFHEAYRPADGMQRFLCGTPPILALAALESGVDLFLEADMVAIVAKSQALCGLMIELVEERCSGLGLSLATPIDPDRRGSHVSFRHEHGYAIMQALIARGVIGDFRDPDILRFGLTPLYLRYEDIWNAVGCLRDILSEDAFRDPKYALRSVVT
jgi:kynureninase